MGLIPSWALLSWVCVNSVLVLLLPTVDDFYSMGEAGLNVPEGSITTRNKTFLPRVVKFF